MSESFWASQDSKTVDETGAKIKQTKSKEDRTADYREWRWNCTNSGYVTDVDHVEWRVVNGILKPVALFELTRVDREIVPHQNYLRHDQIQYSTFFFWLTYTNPYSRVIFTYKFIY